MNGYVTFLSIRGFANLSKEQIKSYYEGFVPDFVNRMGKYRESASVWNSSWDSTIAVFNSPGEAIAMLFDCRELFKSAKAKLKNISPNLEPCILAHFGEVLVLDIKSLGFSNIVMDGINSNEKIDLNLPSRDIYATYDFVYQIKTLKEKISGIKFNEFGMIYAGKNIGEKELYRMWKDNEVIQYIDKFRKADLSYNIPDDKIMSALEESIVKRLNMCSDITKLIQMLSELGINGRSGTFIMILVNIYMKLGAYDKVIEYIEELQNKYSIEANGFMVHPYKYNNELLKTKAKCLYKIGRYEDAYDIYYGILDKNKADSEILMGIASLVRRKAMYDDTGKPLPPMGINRNLLFKAKDLYLEVYRNDSKNIYAALSTAYMYRILGKLEVEKGKKLAKYIIHSWDSKKYQDWTVSSSVSQCLIMVDKFFEAQEVMDKAVQLFNPDMFMRKAVLEDIITYSKFVNTNGGINNILAILKDNR